MGRPPLDVGTYGNITTLARGSRFMATARFRDYDGKTRPVAKYGDTAAQAGRNLKNAILARQRPGGTVIQSDTRIKHLADTWYTGITASDLASGTKRLYGIAIENYIKPSLGDLRVYECTTGAIDRAITVIKDKNGPGAAKSARSVLSGMLGLAARHDAIVGNPTRETQTISRKTRKGRVRALTTDEVDRITDAARSDKFSIEHDLADPIDWLLYTGCRIGEFCAVRTGVNTEGKQILDLETGTWEVNATMIREQGTGLFIQERTKSDAGWRVLALPAGAVGMLNRRAAEYRFTPPQSVIFGSPNGHLRDPSNTSGDLRVFLDSIDCEQCEHRGYNIAKVKGKIKHVRCEAGPFSWVTAHIFRKTVATRMDAAGFTPRQVADQLGHSKPSMTQDVYFGRNVVNAEAAKVLDR